jgi:hypothetical protein
VHRLPQGLFPLQPLLSAEERDSGRQTSVIAGTDDVQACTALEAAAVSPDEATPSAAVAQQKQLVQHELGGSGPCTRTIDVLLETAAQQQDGCDLGTQQGGRILKTDEPTVTRALWTKLVGSKRARALLPSDQLALVLSASKRQAVSESGFFTPVKQSGGTSKQKMWGSRGARLLEIVAPQTSTPAAKSRIVAVERAMEVESLCFADSAIGTPVEEDVAETSQQHDVTVPLQKAAMQLVSTNSSQDDQPHHTRQELQQPASFNPLLTLSSVAAMQTAEASAGVDELLMGTEAYGSVDVQRVVCVPVNDGGESPRDEEETISADMEMEAEGAAWDEGEEGHCLCAACMNMRGFANWGVGLVWGWH